MDKTKQGIKVTTPGFSFENGSQVESVQEANQRTGKGENEQSDDIK